MPIEVVPYDPEWPARFARIRQELQIALRDVPVVGIEHVGSTSVRDLDSKPVIDVDIIVAHPDLDAAALGLTAAGYVHLGDLGIADRHAFRALDDGNRRNVYVVVEGSLSLRNHLAVRAALRADASLRAEYGRIKRELARHTGDIDVYVAGKSAFLLAVLRNAGFTARELAAIEAANAQRREEPTRANQSVP